jgi:type I restriction enzyme M protein
MPDSDKRFVYRELPQETLFSIMDGESKGKDVKNLKELDFERELWRAADRLRGQVDVSEYKHIVLGLIFLKYVSDAFFHRHEFIRARISDPSSDDYIPDAERWNIVLEDRDEYLSAGIFYVPEKARWDYLRQFASHPDIGKYIDEAMELIERENEKQLAGVLPKIYSRTPLPSSVLGELINIFSKIQFSGEDDERDILGRVYEYFLGQFASAEGKKGGEFFTPRAIVKLLVEILEPYENARVFDPCCGSGGMFVQSKEFLRIHYRDPSKISFYGQESNLTTWRLCKMNLAIRGIMSDNILHGDSYYDDKFPDLRADFVIANPPFNAEWDPSRLSLKDPRLKYGIPPASNANFMWIQHFIYHLAPNGMAGFVMANGALAVGGKEGEIRRKIIEDDLIDVIIACPPKLFYNVSLPVSLWFITKDKRNGRFRSRVGEALFIDAREIYTPISRRQNVFTDEQIQRIANTVRAWRGEEGAGEYKDIPGYCKSVTIEEIRRNNYVLTPGRYVGIAEEEGDGIAFEEKMKQLTAELEKYFEEGREIEEKIKENLRRLLGEI